MSLKAFDLVPIVNKLDNLKHSSIECCYYSNTILCIGTNDGHILRYSINKSNYSDENVEFRSVLIDQKLLNNKKPINSIVMATRLQKIIYLSDGNLNMINFDDLQPAANTSLKLKNVTSVCFSEKYTQESSLLCVCVRGRSILLYVITENDVNFYKEIQLQSVCLQMEIDKTFICVACDDSYSIVNIADSSIQTLFSYDIEQLRKPFIAVNSQESEFLVNCLGDLGMFAAYDGQTTRPPIAWAPHCAQFQIYTPYVLCCCTANGETSNSTSTIRVYSMQDGKQKQEITMPMNAGVSLIRFFGEESLMLVATANQVYALNALISYQIDQLIKAKMIDEAIALFESFSANFDSKESFNKQLKNLRKRAGLIELIENNNYSKCEGHFLEAGADYKEIAKLVPDLIKSPVNLSSQEEAYKIVISSWDETKSNQLKQMIIEYMLKSKTTAKNEEFVGTLFKLCVETKSELLNRVDFFTNLPIKYCLQCVKILDEASRFHAHALICYLADEFDKAFEIWKDLCETKTTDENFPGFGYLIEQLSKCKDHQLVWQYVDWAMSKDQRLAVEIFTKRASDELVSERMRTEAIVENLEKYPDALCLYLEYLINVKNLKKEKYTTQLIWIYLDSIIGLLSIAKDRRESDWNEKLETSRAKFQNILESSTNYRVQPVLAKIKEFESSLQRECAILYEKIEEHEKALKIFVYNLNDYQLATNYCLKNSKDSMKLRKQLFNTLFSIYLNPSFNERDKLLKPTLELLNSRLIENFDIPKVLEMIPESWSMKLTGDFLLNVLSSNLSRKRSNLVEKSIANTHKIRLQAELIDLRKEQLYVDDDSRCFKCHKTFESTVLVRLPNGKLTHRLCKSDVRATPFDY